MNNVKILFRYSLAEEEEFEAAENYFDVRITRTNYRENDLIIPRYSALPFYTELEYDILIQRAKLINTTDQFNYVADMRRWYPLHTDITPKTYFSLEEAIQDIHPPRGWVLKGETNSKKFLWDTHMRASNKKELLEIYFRLQEDSLIGDQNICIREFEKFITYEESIHGLPIIKEFRFFVLNQQLVCGDFYWSNFPEIKEEYKLSADEVPREFLQEIIERVGPSNNFYTIDVAQREDGQWRLIELNSGEMSGLSDINPKVLYSRMREILDKKEG